MALGVATGPAFDSSTAVLKHFALRDFKHSPRVERATMFNNEWPSDTNAPPITAPPPQSTSQFLLHDLTRASKSLNVLTQVKVRTLLRLGKKTVRYSCKSVRRAEK